MPPPKSQLQELIAEMQSMQAEQEETNSRLRTRLEWLEARRREFFDLISGNNADYEARKKLEEIESQLDEIQRTLSRAEEELKSSLHRIRRQILEARNAQLTSIEDRIKALRRRRDEIRSKLLPEAQARVDALQEEDRGLGTQIDELTRGIRDLERMEMPTHGQTGDSQVA